MPKAKPIRIDNIQLKSFKVQNFKFKHLVWTFIYCNRRYN